MDEQLAAIGIKKNGNGSQKFIDTIYDLDYDKFQLYEIEQYYCGDKYDWKKRNNFQAYAYIDNQKNTLMIVKVGLFNGLLTQSIDASDRERTGAIVNNRSLTNSNSTNMLLKTIEHIKKTTKNI